MNDLNLLAQEVVTRMRAMSYSVTNEPPFSFKDYNNNNIQDDISIAGTQESAYAEPIQRIQRHLIKITKLESILLIK